MRFYRTQSGFGVERASCGAREKAVFQARDDGGLGQAATIKVERGRRLEFHFECGINRGKR